MLWSLYAIGGADENFLRAQLRHENEHMRIWAVRLLSDLWPLDTVTSQSPAAANIQAGEGQGLVPSAATVNEFTRLAKSDPSGLVRLALATVLQRLPVSHRTGLAAPLLSHSEDAADHNLPLLIWYGLIPVGDTDPAALAKLGAGSQIPLVQKWIARRLGEDIEKNPSPLNALLLMAGEKSEAIQANVLEGLSEALRGWNQAKPPEAWDALQKKLVHRYRTQPCVIECGS